MKLSAFLSLLAAAAVAASLFGAPTPAIAGDPVADALSRLSSRGRVLGTHLRRDQNNREVYEVRILTPDDRIELVYVDPRSGRIVGGARPQRRDVRPAPRPRQDSGNGQWNRQREQPRERRWNQRDGGDAREWERQRNRRDGGDRRPRRDSGKRRWWK
ncbi:MAG: hypothetical protein H6907_03305 [Hyphomicrobiales bacterium]|nr:hypothetical protein [Hyphomicrobiales bacterium]MCP5370735.1 hypothetical protein [Hyphomicrobiales bacterium]